MRKILLVLLLLCVPAFATTYYANACNGQNINGGTCTWNITKGASCAASSTALTWASRAAGDVFNVNGCATIILNVDPGANGSVTLTSDATNTGGTFTCATANNVNITADITATASGSAVVTTTGSTGTGCNITGNITGGGGGGAFGVTDTHTVITNLTVTGNVTGGSVNNVSGYNYNAATGAVIINGNVHGGAGGQGITLGTSGATMTVNNCVGSDANGGGAGCQGGTTTGSGAITIKGSVVSGKNNNGFKEGKFYLAPATAGQAFYYPINPTYASTDIVDASYNVKAPPTYTNTIVAPITCVSGAACYSATTIGNTAKVLTGVTYGPLTGAAPASGSNSGSAH